jgi:hypothetical protein
MKLSDVTIMNDGTPWTLEDIHNVLSYEEDPCDGCDNVYGCSECQADEDEMALENPTTGQVLDRELAYKLVSLLVTLSAEVKEES